MSEPMGTLDPTKGCLVSWGGGGVEKHLDGSFPCHQSFHL
jgi:hypothetical protein